MWIIKPTTQHGTDHPYTTVTHSGLYITRTPPLPALPAAATEAAEGRSDPPVVPPSPRGRHHPPRIPARPPRLLCTNILPPVAPPSPWGRHHPPGPRHAPHVSSGPTKSSVRLTIIVDSVTGWRVSVKSVNNRNVASLSLFSNYWTYSNIHSRFTAFSSESKLLIYLRKRQNIQFCNTE